MSTQKTLWLFQYNPVWEDKEANKQKLTSLIPVRNEGSVFAVFPEMTLTGFSMNPEQTAEPEHGDTTQFFSAFARENNCHCFAGYQEKNKKGYFNSLVHFSSSGEEVARYRKIHLFGYADETKHYQPGTESVITQADNIQTGLAICYDLRFPELFRRYGAAGAELIIIIANWPVTRVAHWRALLRARAIENQCFVVGVNRIGTDPFVSYSGCSSVFSPMGEELYVNDGSEATGVVTLDFAQVAEVRGKFPFLNDIKLL